MKRRRRAGGSGYIYYLTDEEDALIQDLCEKFRDAHLYAGLTAILLVPETKRCTRCGKDVEEARRLYYPICYSCLPPLPPLPPQQECEVSTPEDRLWEEI